MPEPEAPLSLFWMRRDLRLEDNRGLCRALREQGRVLPLFIFDTNILENLPAEDRRISYLVFHLNRLQEALAQWGSGLWVEQGRPLQVVAKLLNDWPVQALYTNHDYEPYALERDQAAEQLCREKGVVFRSFKDQVVFEKDQVLTGQGQPYKVFSPYMKAWKKALSPKELAAEPSEQHLDQLAPLPAQPPLSEAAIGFRPAAYDAPPLEAPTETIANYHKTRDYPAQYGTSRMSVHLRFGTVSPRGLVRLSKDLNTKYYNELIWREFYQMILYQFPHVVTQNFRRQLDGLPWRQAPEDFERWKAGQTGVPLVDAGMRELYQTGYMHNRLRMMTACFLSKHLLIDWRLGEAWFGQQLLDYELGSNNGGWQWAAGTGVDAAPYFRIFSPESQTRRFDPNLAYIRRWVPELDSPEYPQPIVDVKAARQRAIDTFARFQNATGPA